MEEAAHLEDGGVDRKMLLKIVLKEIVWKDVGWIRWLRMHDSGGLT
jgi:hypothetical protein